MGGAFPRDQESRVCHVVIAGAVEGGCWRELFSARTRQGTRDQHIHDPPGAGENAGRRQVSRTVST
jgi:hypothetical protein